METLAAAALGLWIGFVIGVMFFEHIIHRNNSHTTEQLEAWLKRYRIEVIDEDLRDMS